MKKIHIEEEDFELPIEKMIKGNKILKLRNEKVNKDATRKRKKE